MDKLTIEQYKQEMLRQARRARAFDPPAAVPAPARPEPEPELPPMVHMPANDFMQDSFENSYDEPDPFFDTTIVAEDIIPFAQEEDSSDIDNFFSPEPAFEPMFEPVFEPEPQPMPEPQPEAFYAPPAPLSHAQPNAGVISDEEWFGQLAESGVAYPLEPEEFFPDEVEPQPEHFPPYDPDLEGDESTTEYYEMPSPVFSSLAEFKANNPAHGEIFVHVTDHNHPAAGARVQITKQIGGKAYRFYDGYAGRSGSVGPIELPAPRKETAYHETTIPYALYDITVTHGHHRQKLENVPMFADTSGEQVVRMQDTIPINEALYVK